MKGIYLFTSIPWRVEEIWIGRLVQLSAGDDRVALDGVLALKGGESVPVGDDPCGAILGGGDGVRDGRVKPKVWLGAQLGIHLETQVFRWYVSSTRRLFAHSLTH